MTDFKAICHLHNLLHHKNKWYVDVQAPDIDLFQVIAEIAKTEANERLSNISVFSLAKRFYRWQNDDNKIVSPQEDYYYAFLNDCAWNMGLSALSGREQKLYEESINLTIRFI